MTAPDAGATKLSPQRESLTSSLASSGRRPRSVSRFTRYMLGHGILHLVLLVGVAIFLFPFAYMVCTSLKTDDELTETAWLPAVPQFVAQSPHVRDDTVVRPQEASVAEWNAILPKLRSMTRGAVDAAALPPGASVVDVNQYRAAVTDYIIGRVSSRLNIDLWSEPAPKIITAFKAALLPDTINAALDNRLSRLELRGLEAMSVDGHTYGLTSGQKVAKNWTIESGDARFIPSDDCAILKYRFPTSSARPIVIRCDFDYPADPAKLHKLILALRPDDSWHQVDATLDLGGIHWVSQKTKYLGTNRNQSILFQPPSFDDTTDRKRIWVPLKEEGKTADAEPSKSTATTSSLSLPSSATSSAVSHGVLRITLTPSSTAWAIFGKVERNYQRVFESIPFWRYVENSLIVVVLATAGTLLASSFVAYAFARLNWPGRTVAFGLLLSTMMLPAQVTMVPSFMIWRGLGLYNTLCPLWLPAWFGTAFFIFLMVQYMRTIPRELEEAARIDGSSVLRTWAQIILPETKPALAAIAIMVFMASWNEFMMPLIYLRDQSKFPLSIGLYALRLDSPEGGTDWTAIMAGNVLMTLPAVIVFFLFQRYFIEGMTMSGVKG